MKKLLAVFAVLFPTAGFAAGGFYQGATFHEAGYTTPIQVYYCESDRYGRLWLSATDGSFWVANTNRSIGVLAVACQNQFVEFWVDDPIAQTWSNVAFGPSSGAPE